MVFRLGRRLLPSTAAAGPWGPTCTGNGSRGSAPKKNCDRRKRSQSVDLAKSGSGSPAAQRTGAQPEEGEAGERERARLGQRKQLLRVEVAAGEGAFRNQGWV